MFERSEIERILHEELERARLHYDSETTDFRSATKGMVATDANFPDETAAIHIAGTERRDALGAYVVGLKRFTAFIIDGIVPEDLKK
jgi:hypothetical protein